MATRAPRSRAPQARTPINPAAHLSSPGHTSWSPAHQRLFDQLEAVDPITPEGKRQQDLRAQRELADWTRKRQDEQDMEKAGATGWDAFSWKGR